MTNKELQEYLKQYSDDMPVKLLPCTTVITGRNVSEIIDLTDENILHTSDAAYVDESAPEEEWDTEDGKTVYAGNRFLLFNPIIV